MVAIVLPSSAFRADILFRAKLVICMYFVKEK